MPASLSGEIVTGEIVAYGTARGTVAYLTEALSFWGGFDARSGLIVEQSHPQCGLSLAGKILLMARAKGSSSSSSVLAEAIRNGTAPAGIVMLERDLIIALGSIVAAELYAQSMPIVTVEPHRWEQLAAAPATVQLDAAAGERARIIIE
jgi:predicted aconitase with swiveling domain